MDETIIEKRIYGNKWMHITAAVIWIALTVANSVEISTGILCLLLSIGIIERIAEDITTPSEETTS